MKLSKIIRFKETRINILSIIISLIITTIVFLPINALSKKTDNKKSEDNSENDIIQEEQVTSGEKKLLINELEENLLLEKNNEQSYIEEINQRKIITINENNQFGIKIRNLKPGIEAVLIINGIESKYKLSTNYIVLEDNKDKCISKAPEDGLIIIIKQKDISKGIRVIIFKKV